MTTGAVRRAKLQSHQQRQSNEGKYVLYINTVLNKLCGRPPQYAPASCVKVASESRVTWATSVPISVFLGLSVLDLGPMYATDRRQTSDAHHR